MALTFDAVRAHIRNTLGGDISAENDVYDIINNAGDFMASMYPWRWLENTEIVTITGTGQYSLSGLNFVELISYSPRGADSTVTTANGAFYHVSMQEILDKRETTADNAALMAAVPAGAFYFTIAYDSNNGAAAATPKLEVAPYPTGSGGTHDAAIGKITLTYRRAWNTITATTSTFVLPAWMEPLYIQCVRAFARGYEEEDLATSNRRLQEVMVSPLVDGAIERDSLIESTTQRVVRRSKPTSLAGLAGNNSLSR